MPNTHYRNGPPLGFTYIPNLTNRNRNKANHFKYKLSVMLVRNYSVSHDCCITRKQPNPHGIWSILRHRIAELLGIRMTKQKLIPNLARSCFLNHSFFFFASLQFCLKTLPHGPG